MWAVTATPTIGSLKEEGLEIMMQAKSRSFSVRRVTVALVTLFAIGTGVGWYFDVLGISPARPPANSLMVISPYYDNGTWVFDDPRVGLVREPFVAGSEAHVRGLAPPQPTTNPLVPGLSPSGP